MHVNVASMIPPRYRVLEKVGEVTMSNLGELQRRRGEGGHWPGMGRTPRLKP